MGFLPGTPLWNIREALGGFWNQIVDFGGGQPRLWAVEGRVLGEVGHVLRQSVTFQVLGPFPRCEWGSPSLAVGDGVTILQERPK